MEPVLTIVAAIGGKSPFVSPPEQRGEAGKEHGAFLLAGGSNSYSDHLAVVAAYDAWQAVMRAQGNAAAYQFCRERFLSHSVLLDMQALREHFRAHLANAGFLPEPSGQAATDAEGEEESLFAEGLAPLTLGDEVGRVIDAHKAGGTKASAKNSARVISAAPQAATNGLPDNADLVRCILCAGRLSVFVNFISVRLFYELIVFPQVWLRSW